MSRRRRQQCEEEHENHERWLVSYADFITLLFAFFVVMYAVSSVNEGKYRVLSDSIVSAFRNVPGATITPPAVLESSTQVVVRPQIVPNKPALAAGQKGQAKEAMRNMAQEIKDALGPLIKDGQVRVTEGPMGITIEINASVLFLPGDARLGEEAVRALTVVGQILATTDFPITVEGHTDNIPINTLQFPSNWELSGVRASSVVRLFIDTGVAASRLTATGYADQRPVADNVLADGRMRNRRVAILIESKSPEALLSVPVPLQSGQAE